jgi:hypothetical protein
MGSGIYSIGSNGDYVPRFNPPANLSNETEWWTNSSLNGIQLFADGQGNLYLRGSIHARNGYFQGTVFADRGEFRGNVYANDGFFRGNIFANDLFLRNQSVLNSMKDRIMGGFLELDGLIVRNGGVNTMTVNGGIIQFGTGTRSITVNNGGVTLGSGVSLTWGNLPADVASSFSVNQARHEALESTRSLANGTYTGSTFINGRMILSPVIGAGAFCGARYFNLTNFPGPNVPPTANAYMTMNTSGYFEIVTGSNRQIIQGNEDLFGATRVFELHPSIQGDRGVRFVGYGDTFLGYNQTQRRTWAFGTWDFGLATVVNMNLTARWA